MKVSFTFAVLFLLVVVSLPAQRTCRVSTVGNGDALEVLRAAKVRAKIEYACHKWLSDTANSKAKPPVITIPVVVHVVHRLPAENVSVARVLSQLDVLNEDFGRMNLDSSLTPVAWQNIAVDTRIQFCLASRDPSGNLSTGITRTLTSVTSFSQVDDVKFTSSGGSDAWPRDDYLNIWVCNMAFGEVGYSQFPGGSAATDGVVINYRFFGRGNGVQPPFNLGRIGTHEVGHWLNLMHIWGDDGGDCTGDDLVADTPNQAGYSLGCPVFPVTDLCSSASPGIMFMNYMDFSDDSCLNMFTAGQRDRMLACLATVRGSLSFSQGCNSPNQVPLDVAVTAILAPAGTLCSNQVLAEFTVTNWGADSLSSFTINWMLDGGNPQSLLWMGNLNSLNAMNLTLPAQAVMNGNHVLTIWTSGPNGQQDDAPGNDTLSTSFTITAQVPGLTLPFFESFETGNFPPVGWSIVNPDNGLTWERVNTIGYQSLKSVWLDNFDYNTPGQLDELVLPPLDLTTAFGPSLKFEMAYALYNSAGFSDTLQIWISTDCGNTFTNIFEKYGPQMATVSPYFQQSPFEPQSDAEWRTEIVNLVPFQLSNSVIIKFRNITDFENNLYLDNISVLDIPVALEDKVLENEVFLYPNPSEGIFKMLIETEVTAAVTVHVFDAFGKHILNKTKVYTAGDDFEIDLSGVQVGVYFVRIMIGNRLITKTVVRE